MKQQRVETEDENWVKSIKIESCEEPESIPSTKIKVLNIPNLIGFFLGNEQKIKEASKEALITKNMRKIRKTEKSMIKRDNQAMMRLTCSSFSSSYAAVEKYISS